MGLIKGITIKLVEADGTEADISNALPIPSNVTQDQQAEWNLGGIRPDYTIAIPKGDSHNWLGARATFFDESWEVIAQSGVTIDHLTPLSWNRRAYVIREMTDRITLKTLRGRTRSESGLIKDDYKDVEVDALTHPVLLDNNHERYRDGSKISRRVIVRQSDFDAAGVSGHEPIRANVGSGEYAIESYDRAGDIVMVLTLVTEV